jgi:hypothetical protein
MPAVLPNSRDWESRDPKSGTISCGKDANEEREDKKSKPQMNADGRRYPLRPPTITTVRDLWIAAVYLYRPTEDHRSYLRKSAYICGSDFSFRA